MLPVFVVDVLLNHRIHQEKERNEAGTAWIDKKLVFANTQGYYISESSTLKTFKRLLVKSGLPCMRFHDLRHSAATILLTMGVHPKVVQEILGHSQIAMTMDIYSHVMPSMHKDVTKLWDAEFKEPPK